MAKFQLTGQLQQISWDKFVEGIKDNDTKIKSSCPFANGDVISIVRDASGFPVCQSQEYELDGTKSDKLNYTIKVKNQRGIEFFATLGLFKGASAVDYTGAIISVSGAVPVNRNEDRSNTQVCTYLSGKDASFTWKVLRRPYTAKWEERVFPASLLTFTE